MFVPVTILSAEISDATAAGRAVLTAADAAAQRAALGLGALATQDGTFSGASSGTNTGDQDLSAYATSAAVAAGYLPLSGGTMSGPLAVASYLSLTGSTTTNFTSPVGSPLPTKLNVPLFDPGAFGQVVAMGIPAGAPATARVLMVCDARAVPHQATLMVLSPNEDESGGFSWDGSNTVLRLKSSKKLELAVNGLTTATAVLTLDSGSAAVTGDLTATGNVSGTWAGAAIETAKGGVPTGGTTNQVLAKSSNSDYAVGWADAAGGGGSPGGADTQVQFNDGGSFGGATDLVYAASGRVEVLDTNAAEGDRFLVKHNNGNVLFGVNNSRLVTDISASASSPGTIVKAIPVHTSGGTFLGYLPLYDSL